MKKLKLIMAVVTAFVCLNFVYGVNPKQKDFTINLGNNMVNHLCKTIHLTDSQKTVILAKAKNYEVKVKKEIKEKDNAKRKSNTKLAINEYRNFLNDILTQEQKDTLNLKRIERLNNINDKN
ncbi:MAG: hypothetical protein PHS59_15385 [Paludibacter sp.]|nr:hypothetical protein [Paludibacter sp.]